MPRKLQPPQHLTAVVPIPKHKGRRRAVIDTPKASVHGETVVPDDYRADALEYLCERIMLGDKLADICSDDLMPSFQQISKWLAHDPGFKARFIEAQRVRALIDSARLQDIADGEVKVLKTEEITANNEAIVTLREVEEDPARSRIRVDALKWRLSRLHPDIFGDKVEIGHNVTGELARMIQEASNQGHKLPKVSSG